MKVGDSVDFVGGIIIGSEAETVKLPRYLL